MYTKLVILLLACAHSAMAKPSIPFAGPLFAPAPILAPSAITAPIVTSRSSQIVQRNYNALAAPVFSPFAVPAFAKVIAPPAPVFFRQPFAAPVVAPAPFLAPGPVVGPAPFVAPAPAIAPGSFVGPGPVVGPSPFVAPGPFVGPAPIVGPAKFVAPAPFASAPFIW